MKTLPKQPTPRRSPITYLTQEETKRLFAAIKRKRDKAIFLTVYRHGLRASEVGLLHITDADMKRGRLTIQRLKGSLDGVQPMQPSEIKALRAYLRTREDGSPFLFVSSHRSPISRYQLHELMTHYGERAGLPRAKQKFHALRHSIATHLLDAGADIAFVRDWLGHANISNTIIYARLTNPTRDQTARRVFASHRVV